MQEKVEFYEVQDKNKQNQQLLIIPPILPFQQQKQRLKCLKGNQSKYACISSTCQFPGLICITQNCQCQKIHENCHHTLINRILKKIQAHHKQIPKQVLQSFQIIYQKINIMIQKLSLLRQKFHKRQKYYGLRQQQLDFLQLIYDKKVNSINGQIISSLEQVINQDIKINIPKKEEVTHYFKIRIDHIEKICTQIQQQYLLNGSQKFSVALFNNSQILKKRSDRQLLYQWLLSIKSDTKNHLNSELLFRASEHNFLASQFHKYCDEKQDTITIIKNQYNKIIGGFSKKPWSSSFGGTLDKTYKSFIFSISLKQKYKCFRHQYAIYNDVNKGPCFGQYDICLSNKCNLDIKSYGDLGSNYNIITHNSYKYKYQNKQTRFLFTGNPNDKYFKVKQYEVYQIKGLQN